MAASSAVVARAVKAHSPEQGALEDVHIVVEPRKGAAQCAQRDGGGDLQRPSRKTLERRRAEREAHREAAQQEREAAVQRNKETYAPKPAPKPKPYCQLSRRGGRVAREERHRERRVAYQESIATTKQLTLNAFFDALLPATSSGKVRKERPPKTDKKKMPSAVKRKERRHLQWEIPQLEKWCAEPLHEDETEEDRAANVAALEMYKKKLSMLTRDTKKDKETYVPPSARVPGPVKKQLAGSGNTARPAPLPACSSSTTTNSRGSAAAAGTAQTANTRRSSSTAASSSVSAKPAARRARGRRGRRLRKSSTSSSASAVSEDVTISTSRYSIEPLQPRRTPRTHTPVEFVGLTAPADAPLGGSSFTFGDLTDGRAPAITVQQATYAASSSSASTVVPTAPPDNDGVLAWDESPAAAHPWHPIEARSSQSSSSGSETDDITEEQARLRLQEISEEAKKLGDDEDDEEGEGWMCPRRYARRRAYSGGLLIDTPLVEARPAPKPVTPPPPHLRDVRTFSMPSHGHVAVGLRRRERQVNQLVLARYAIPVPPCGPHVVARIMSKRNPPGVVQMTPGSKECTITKPCVNTTTDVDEAKVISVPSDIAKKLLENPAQAVACGLAVTPATLKEEVEAAAPHKPHLSENKALAEFLLRGAQDAIVQTTYDRNGNPEPNGPMRHTWVPNPETTLKKPVQGPATSDGRRPIRQNDAPIEKITTTAVQTTPTKDTADVCIQSDDTETAEEATDPSDYPEWGLEHPNGPKIGGKTPAIVYNHRSRDFELGPTCPEELTYKLRQAAAFREPTTRLRLRLQAMCQTYFHDKDPDGKLSERYKYTMMLHSVQAAMLPGKAELEASDMLRSDRADALINKKAAEARGDHGSKWKFFGGLIPYRKSYRLAVADPK